MPRGAPLPPPPPPLPSPCSPCRAACGPGRAAETVWASPPPGSLARRSLGCAGGRSRAAAARETYPLCRPLAEGLAQLVGAALSRQEVNCKPGRGLRATARHAPRRPDIWPAADGGADHAAKGRLTQEPTVNPAALKESTLLDQGIEAAHQGASCCRFCRPLSELHRRLHAPPHVQPCPLLPPTQPCLLLSPDLSLNDHDHCTYSVLRGCIAQTGLNKLGSGQQERDAGIALLGRTGIERGIGGP